MPSLPLPKCKIPTCMERVAERNKSYCKHHQRDLYKEEQRRSYDPFYSSPSWRATRRHYIGMNPFCVICESMGRITEASVVDHIRARELGGEDFDQSNLQSLCESCHNKKRTQERAELRARRGIG